VEEPVFAFAIIFTPSYRTDDEVPQGASATDPIYSSQINQIKTVLINQLPGFTAANSAQKIKVAIYKPVASDHQMVLQPWFGLLTFEYVPQHLHRDENGDCSVARAIRVWNQDKILGIFAYSWPNQPAAAGPSKSKFKSKRQNEGTCPANLADIVNSQGNGASEPQSIYDVNAPAAASSTVQVPPPAATTTTSPPPPPSPPPTPNTDTSLFIDHTIAITSFADPAPPIPTLPPPPSGRIMSHMCSNWLLSPNGMEVGTNCDGDPNSTVTHMVPEATLPARRAITTTF
jgi:hypothetical protein